MHELGIAQSGLRAAITEMERHEAKRILSITLRIGDLAAVDPDALRFAFKAVTLGTVAEGAELIIDRVRALAWCRQCQLEFKIDGLSFFKCPHCGEYSGDLRTGREIELARLEMD